MLVAFVGFLHCTHRFVIGLLLLKLLHKNTPLFVLAPLVLKPNANDSGAETCHLHQLLLHKCIGPGVGVVAGPQRVELFLVEHCPDARRLLWLLVDVGPKRRLSGRNGLCCK